MADAGSLPRLKEDRFKRLVQMFQLLLRVFSSKDTIDYKDQDRPAFDQHVSPRHRATKIKHQLSLSEMAQQGTKEMIAEKIHRRLQTQISDNRGNDSTVLGNNQTASESSVLSERTKQTLLNSSWNRSADEMEEAYKELQCCSAFQDYPPAIQRRLCKLGWYQRVHNGRVIVREGHRPMCFYLILSGTVKVTKRRNRSEDFLQDLTAGDTFGEISTNPESKNSTTYSAKGQAELFVISKSDYLDLSLRQTRQSYQKSKHFGFCNTINILKHWPLLKLETQPGICKVSSFKPNVVVEKDSKKSKWIYVVMAGTCRVVKRFIDHTTEQRKKYGRTYPTELHGGKSTMPRSVATGTSIAGSQRLGESHTQGEETPCSRRKMKHAHTVGSLQQLAGKSGRQLQPIPPLPRRKQFLVQLQILQPKDVFGLSAIIHTDEPSVTLISNGAELVMISRGFIEHHLTEVLKMKVQRQVAQYPSEEAMKKRIRDHYTWNMYKQAMTGHTRRRLL